MTRPSLGTARTPLAFAAVPGTRAWFAGCAGLGGFLLCLFLGCALAERARAAHRSLAQAVLAVEAAR